MLPSSMTKLKDPLAGHASSMTKLKDPLAGHASTHIFHDKAEGSFSWSCFYAYLSMYNNNDIINIDYDTKTVHLIRRL